MLKEELKKKNVFYDEEFDYGQWDDFSEERLTKMSMRNSECEEPISKTIIEMEWGSILGIKGIDDGQELNFNLIEVIVNKCLELEDVMNVKQLSEELKETGYINEKYKFEKVMEELDKSWNISERLSEGQNEISKVISRALTERSNQFLRTLDFNQLVNLLQVDYQYVMTENVYDLAFEKLSLEDIDYGMITKYLTCDYVRYKSDRLKKVLEKSVSLIKNAGDWFVIKDELTSITKYENDEGDQNLEFFENIKKYEEILDNNEKYQQYKKLNLGKIEVYPYVKRNDIEYDF